MGWVEACDSAVATPDPGCEACFPSGIAYRVWPENISRLDTTLVVDRAMRNTYHCHSTDIVLRAWDGIRM